MGSISDSSLSLLNTGLQWFSVLSIGFGLIAAIGLVFVSAEIGRRQEQQIVKLMPKPFKNRLRVMLEQIDPKIIPALEGGRTNFEGGITPTQFVDLQRLASEPGAKAFIVIDQDVKTGLGMGPHGITYGVKFHIDPSILGD